VTAERAHGEHVEQHADGHDELGLRSAADASW
jgi:hypothetical protein